MSGPQFIHIETYARSVSKLRKEREAARAGEGKLIDRKLTAEEVCGEAARLEGHCPHVAMIKAPVLLLGISPDQVPAVLEARVLEANAAIKAGKASMAKGARRSGPRAIRNDTHALLTMITSHPTPWVDPGTGDANFEHAENRVLLQKWEERNLSWTIQKAKELGMDLVSVVRHEDEAYPHLHFLFLPHGRRLDARASHPGYIAQKALEREEGEDDKAFRRRGNKAYIQAMRAFQDDYYTSVSLDSGLLRTGPKRQRLSRAAYMQEKDAGRARALASVRSEQLAEEVEQAQEALAESRGMLVIADGDAVGAIIRAEDLKAENHVAERELMAKRAEAASLEQLSLYRQEVAIELQREEVALKAAQVERAETDAQASRVRAEVDSQLAEAERVRREVDFERDKLDREKKEFAKEKREGECMLAEQRMEVEAGKKEIDAIVEGVEAFAEGRLRFDPANRSKPFTLVARRTGEDQRLFERLAAVKPRLAPVIARLDAAITRRAAELTDALSAAVTGWTNGLLRGGEPGEGGQSTIHVPRSSEGDELLKKISPFREVVAQVISALPDHRIVVSVKKGLSRFGSRLAAAEQAEAQEFARNQAMLERGNERE